MAAILDVVVSASMVAIGIAVMITAALSWSRGAITTPATAVSMAAGILLIFAADQRSLLCRFVAERQNENLIRMLASTGKE